jgi:hypothetical protein
MAQPPRIITNFSIELSRILSDYLSNPEIEDKRIPLKDRLAIKLMLTLNKQVYRDKLLFRDFSKNPSDLFEKYVTSNGSIKKLHIESIYYTQDVLAKRLTIVSKHKSLPSNLHLLLLMLFRYSEDDKWLKTRIKRKKTHTCINDLYFKRTANILKRQCNQLKCVGSVSKTYREKYGIFHFISGNNSTELVEEISLFDVVEVIPTPLKKSLTKFPRWYAPLLERIVLSLNEKYALLRSCGLPPDLWHDELSVSKLRALKQLKKMADSYKKSAQKNDVYSVYQQAFLTLLNEKTKVAGFEDFISFSHSSVGRALLKMETVSIDGENENSYSLTDTYSEADNNSNEMEAALKTLLVDNRSSFSAVSAYFFEQVLILQRPLYSESGVFNDTEFCNALKSDSAYSNLEGEKLADKLIRTTQRIIKKHINVEHAKEWLEEDTLAN